MPWCSAAVSVFLRFCLFADGCARWGALCGGVAPAFLQVCTSASALAVERNEEKDREIREAETIQGYPSLKLRSPISFLVAPVVS
jgi:hypothetical protein